MQSGNDTPFVINSKHVQLDDNSNDIPNYTAVDEFRVHLPQTHDVIRRPADEEDEDDDDSHLQSPYFSSAEEAQTGAADKAC